jgi:hypothetical protein
MDEQVRLAVFQAQTENVRALHQAWKHINRQTNASLLNKDSASAEINTKLLAVIYCALAEAVFSKLIHTPYGLTLDEIDQIKKAGKQGVKLGWTKCAELAIRRVEGTKPNHPPNALQKLTALINEFIYDPSLLRNKIAHGQWRVALNTDHTAINVDLTKEIAGYTVVEFYRRRHSLQRLSSIIEDLIESPNKAHRKDYWKHLAEMEAEQSAMATWTVVEKTAQLRSKKSFAP